MTRPESRTSNRQITWKGEKGRALQVCRPCSCGCDERDGFKGVGYVTGSNAKGNGFTIWIENDEVFNNISAVLGGRKAVKNV
jgi:hypothetical protein